MGSRYTLRVCLILWPGVGLLVSSIPILLCYQRAVARPRHLFKFAIVILRTHIHSTVIVRLHRSMPIPTFFPGCIVASSRHTPARFFANILHARYTMQFRTKETRDRARATGVRSSTSFASVSFYSITVFNPQPRDARLQLIRHGGTSINFYGRQVSSEKSMTTGD